MERLYEDNPFRVLALPATASTQEVRARLGELAVRVNIGVGPNGLTADHLGRLRQALDDPVERLRCELFWLHSPDLVPDTKTGTDGWEAAVSRADALAASPEGTDQGRGAAIARHDRAVLLHAGCLRPDGHAAANHFAALGEWARVQASDKFWAYMVDRAHAAADPRATPDVVENLRGKLPALVLDPVASLAAERIYDGDDRSAVGLVDAMRRSGFGAEFVDAAIRTVVAPLVARVKEGLQLLKETCEDLPDEPGAADAVEASRLIAQATSVLVDRVLGPLDALAAFDHQEAAAPIGDQVARDAMDLAIQSVSYLGDWRRTLVLANEALHAASSRAVVAEIKARRDQVHFGYYSMMRQSAAERGDRAAAIAHAELGARFIPDPVTRQQELRQVASFRRSQPSRVRAQADTLVAKEEATLGQRLPRPEPVGLEAPPLIVDWADPNHATIPPAQPQGPKHHSTPDYSTMPTESGGLLGGQSSPPPSPVVTALDPQASPHPAPAVGPSTGTDHLGSSPHGQSKDGPTSPPPPGATAVGDVGAPTNGTNDVAPERPRQRPKRSPWPVALGKAFGATTALLMATVTLASAVGTLVDQKASDAAAGGAFLGVSFVALLGIALWVGRQAGWRWAAFGILLWIVAFPAYVYKQNRGKRRRASDTTVAKFRTARTAGGMIAVAVALFVAAAMTDSSASSDASESLAGPATQTPSAGTDRAVAASGSTRTPTPPPAASAARNAALAAWATEEARPGSVPAQRADPSLSPTPTLPEGVPTGSTTATVTDVLTGDTILLRMGRTVVRVRLAGIAAGTAPPENRQAESKPRCFADAASRHLEALLPSGQTVYLEQGKLPDREADGTLTRYVWFVPDGGLEPRLASRTLIRGGYATLDGRVPDRRHDASLRRAEAAATEEGKGLWSACRADPEVGITPMEGSPPIERVGTGNIPS